MEAAEGARALKEMTLALQDRMGAEAEAAHTHLSPKPASALRPEAQVSQAKPGPALVPRGSGT